MFQLDDFVARAKLNLLREPPTHWDNSDDDMNERARMIPDGVTTRPAAVLVAVILRKEPTVLLTMRQAHLTKHASQIAFPGGRLDEGETVLDAALREAEEEVGLARHFVEPLGYGKGFLTITHYVVTPVLALVREGFALRLQPDEVAEAFEVPLSFLMDQSNCQTQAREFKGLPRHFYVYPFGNRYIWGATAGMIKALHGLIYS